MNSETVRSSSRFMAGRVIDRVGRDPEAQVERVYLAALGRPAVARRAGLEPIDAGGNDRGVETASGAGPVA